MKTPTFPTSYHQCSNGFTIFFAHLTYTFMNRRHEMTMQYGQAFAREKMDFGTKLSGSLTISGCHKRVNDKIS